LRPPSYGASTNHVLPPALEEELAAILAHAA
jgi:hypothetical protein